MPKKNSIHIPYEILPESRNWKPGHSYRTKMVLKQTGTDENGAMFEAMDATSLEPHEARRQFLSDSGTLRT
jgi:hypothetical protein